MNDLEIILQNETGALALVGETLGANGISLEGGGMFQFGDICVAHFLVKEADKAQEVLQAAGIAIPKINAVIIQKLRQDIPGQLGLFCRRMAASGVNILVQYSDHANQLIVVVDDYQKGIKVSEAWMKEWW